MNLEVKLVLAGLGVTACGWIFPKLSTSLPFAPTLRYFFPVIPLVLLGIGYALNEMSAIGFKPKKE